MKTNNIQKLENFFGQIYRDQIHGESSVNDFLNWSDYEEEELSFDWLTDLLLDQNGFFEVEVIYYSNAINYLVENDPSLNESLEIASEFGYSLASLSSEVLASLLKSRNFYEEWQKLENKIDTFFEELKNDNE